MVIQKRLRDKSEPKEIGSNGERLNTSSAKKIKDLTPNSEKSKS